MSAMPNADVADSLVFLVFTWVRRQLKQLLKPAAMSIMIGAATDLTRTIADLANRLRLLLLARIART